MTLSLTARLYLLSIDPRTKRAVHTGKLGQLLRAAALTELLRAGRIADDGGRVKVTGRGEVRDPVHDLVLQQVAASGPKKWKHWVDKDARRTTTAVREALADAGVVKVRPVRLFRVWPAHEVAIADRRPVQALAASAGRALTGSTPVSRLEPDDLLLAVLAALGEFDTVASGKERRAHRDRIAALVEAGGPAVVAVRKVIQDQQSAAAAV